MSKSKITVEEMVKQAPKLVRSRSLGALYRKHHMCELFDYYCNHFTRTKRSFIYGNKVVYSKTPYLGAVYSIIHEMHQYKEQEVREAIRERRQPFAQATRTTRGVKKRKLRPKK